MRRALLLLLLENGRALPKDAWKPSLLVDAGAFNVSAVFETKFQVDNRFSKSPRLLGELWGDVDLLEGGRWRAHLSWAGRFSSLSDDSGGKLYQAFLERLWPDLGALLRLGRFQRTDLAGFYLLDGGQLDLHRGKWRLQGYGGRPLRLDHVRGIEGEWVAGGDVGYVEAGLDRCWRRLCAHGYRLDLSYQEFHGQGHSRRLRGSFSAQGALGEGRPFEVAAAATYRFERGRFEEVWFYSFVDLTPRLRFRTNYEYYRPRSPFPTFRERFVSAYALGEQSLFRAELHHRPLPWLHGFVGGQRATRADGFDGYGIVGGGDLKWGETAFALRYDFLEIGRDRAHSGYAHLLRPFTPRLEGWLNGAIRKEVKRLYGVNWAFGGEFGFRYQLGGGWVVETSLSYIANTGRKDDYVGAVRLTYYLDRFRPKMPEESRLGTSRSTSWIAKGRFRPKARACGGSC